MPCGKYLISIESGQAAMAHGIDSYRRLCVEAFQDTKVKRFQKFLGNFFVYEGHGVNLLVLNGEFIFLEKRQPRTIAEFNRLAIVY
jgi:hypothetical protein